MISVYPRWRGEHGGSLPVVVSGAGLSPLARGTRGGSTKHILSRRFIPAGAGNTGVSVTSTPAVSGLSPLARGTLCVKLYAVLLCRFIPAGAGNTSDAYLIITGYQVYPRWRGEHLCDNAYSLIFSGLSPLARGTHKHHYQRNHVFRFIPAGAGNTRTHRSQPILAAVYPRWRGEHINGLTSATGDVGLSPLARGTPVNKLQAERISRFIPAGAGNTREPVFVFQHETVYPRWRGEHAKLGGDIFENAGLSPLARGTRRVV